MLNYDALAQAYVQHRQVHPEVLKLLLQVGEVKPTTKILEIGCGTGNYSNALLAATDCQVMGIDPSFSMLRKAVEKTPDYPAAVGTGEEIPFPEKTFDFAFSVDVIHHIRGREAHIQEVYRILKPGGRFCMVTDSPEIIQSRQPLARYFPETIDVDLKRYPNIHALEALITKAGFKNIQQVQASFTFTTTNIQPYREKAFSCLHLISNEGYLQGVKKMEEDLRAGPISCVPQYLLLWGTR